MERIFDYLRSLYRDSELCLFGKFHFIFVEYDLEIKVQNLQSFIWNFNDFGGNSLDYEDYFSCLDQYGHEYVRVLIDVLADICDQCLLVL